MCDDQKFTLIFFLKSAEKIVTVLVDLKKKGENYDYLIRKTKE